MGILCGRALSGWGATLVALAYKEWEVSGLGGIESFWGRLNGVSPHRNTDETQWQLQGLPLVDAAGKDSVAPTQSASSQMEW